MRRPCIALVGLMGAGKTSVGREVAERLAVPFIDLDEEIVRRQGCSIPDIFAASGETGFRRMEHDVLQDVTMARAGQGGVLATGGGVVVTPENRTLLRASWHVVWLRARVETLVERLARDEAERPLLQTGHPLAMRVRELARIRTPWYREVAHAVVDVDGLSVAAVAEQVIQSWCGAVSSQRVREGE
ncbi:shikimate kinase [Alicyclobacillus cellulosilyticus]|uniref:shikimate kinase n=1 Tax=Alicyclobacillus cellulosilyticus TaxID=1003997 RepID=UPI001667C8A5|nr:shikimate kinase [Alicyclobacillus cellulosilyticus]